MHENIEEFHSGKTYSRTKAKFGKQTADKQAVLKYIKRAGEIFGKRQAAPIQVE